MMVDPEIHQPESAFGRRRTDDAPVERESLLKEVERLIEAGNLRTVYAIWKSFALAALGCVAVTFGAIYFQADNNANQAARLANIELYQDSIDDNRSAVSGLAQTVSSLVVQMESLTKAVDRLQNQQDRHEHDHPGPSSAGVIFEKKR
jgi:uncharacterized protein HemX